MKKLISALLISTSLVTGASAFYNKSTGQWVVEGKPVIGDMNPVCQIETAWQYGAKMALINDLSDEEIYIGYYNPLWNLTDPPGTVAPLVLEIGDTKTSLKINLQFEVVSKTTIRIRNLNPEFYVLFAKATGMILHMPGNIPDVKVGLKGTRLSMNFMLECRGLAKELGIISPQPLPNPVPSPVIPKKPGIPS